MVDLGHCIFKPGDIKIKLLKIHKITENSDLIEPSYLKLRAGVPSR